MSRAFIVAASEFVTATRGKGFLIGLLLMPVLFGGAILVQRMVDRQADTRERRLAVVDDTGRLYDRIVEAAEAWNRGERDLEERVERGPTFVPERVDPGSTPREELRLTLSERVRRDEIFAFVELPATLLDPASTDPIRYFSASPSYGALPNWIRLTVNKNVLRHRFEQAAISPLVVAELVRPVRSEEFGLLARARDGGVREAESVDRVRTLAIPAGFMLMLFIIVMTTTPQLLNSVLEEKMSRISEVMLGSIAPFDLMLGKLLSSAAVSLVLAGLYVAGAIGAAFYFGYGDAVRPALVAWFVLFLCVAVLNYGAIFIAIGAACTDLRDAQSMMTPAMFILMVPVLTWTAVMRAPDSTLAVGMSLFPPATPFLLLLRLALQEPPPAWQVAAGLLLSVGFMLATVWAAGRIFSTGLLQQGRSATLRELWGWIRGGGTRATAS